MQTELCNKKGRIFMSLKDANRQNYKNKALLSDSKNLTCPKEEENPQ